MRCEVWGVGCMLIDSVCCQLIEILQKMNSEVLESSKELTSVSRTHTHTPCSSPLLTVHIHARTHAEQEDVWRAGEGV